jgi:hypothetical protein
MKSGNLNFLEPSGPPQAGNGADCFTFFTNEIYTAGAAEIHAKTLPSSIQFGPYQFGTTPDLKIQVFCYRRFERY